MLKYGVTAMFFFIVGGVEALLIRLQLAQPNGTVLSAEKVPKKDMLLKLSVDLGEAAGGEAVCVPGGIVARVNSSTTGLLGASGGSSTTPPISGPPSRTGARAGAGA